MSKTLSTMTAAELVAELKESTQDRVVRCMNHSCYHPNPPYLLGGFCEKCGSGLSKRWCYEQLANPKLISELTAELDARCESAGIKPKPDGTFYVPEFTGTVDEMKERAALINYFTHKQ